MAIIATVSLADFHERYSSEKGYEYWFGEVVRKAAPITFPMKSIDIVIEVLSPNDCFRKLDEKCLHYSRIGIRQIFVLDPDTTRAWEWNHQRENLEHVVVLDLHNGKRVARDEEVWPEMTRRVAR